MIAPGTTAASRRCTPRCILIYGSLGLLLCCCTLSLLFLAHSLVHPIDHSQTSIVPGFSLSATTSTMKLDSTLAHLEALCKSVGKEARVESVDSGSTQTLTDTVHQLKVTQRQPTKQLILTGESLNAPSTLASSSSSSAEESLYRCTSARSYLTRSDWKWSDSFLTREFDLAVTGAAGSGLSQVRLDALQAARRGYFDSTQFLHLPPWDGSRPMNLAQTSSSRAWKDRMGGLASKESGEKNAGGSLSTIASASTSTDTPKCSSLGPVRCCAYDFRVFVWPLPSVYNVGLMEDFKRDVRDSGGHWTGRGHSFPSIWNPTSLQMQFTTEIALGNMLAKHPCRTMDPASATFSFLPVWGYYLYRFTDKPSGQSELREKALALISCYLRKTEPACVRAFWLFLDEQIEKDWNDRERLERQRKEWVDLSPYPPSPSFSWDMKDRGRFSRFAEILMKNDLRDHLVPASRPYGWAPHPWATWPEEPSRFIHLQYETWLQHQQFEGMRAKNIQVPVVPSGAAIYAAHLIWAKWKYMQKRLALQEMFDGFKRIGESLESESSSNDPNPAAASFTNDLASVAATVSSQSIQLDPILCGGLDLLMEHARRYPVAPEECIPASNITITREGVTCPSKDHLKAYGMISRLAKRFTCSFGRIDISDPTLIPSEQFPLSNEPGSADARDQEFMRLHAMWERLVTRDYLLHYLEEFPGLKESIVQSNPKFQFKQSRDQSEEHARVRDWELLELQRAPSNKDAQFTLGYEIRPLKPADFFSLPSQRLPHPLSRPIFAFFFGTPGIHPTRALIRGMLLQEPDCVFVNTTTRELVADFASYYLQATFCFILAGDTPGSKRLYDAILGGCIPVFVNDRWGPTFSFLPWHRFSVRYSEARVQSAVFDPKDLMWQLRRISPLEILEMQRQLFYARSFFIYPLDHLQAPHRAIERLDKSRPEGLVPQQQARGLGGSFVQPQLDKTLLHIISRKFPREYDFKPRAWDAMEGIMVELERRVEYAQNGRFTQAPMTAA